MEREEAIESVRKLYNESLFLKKDKEAMVTLIPELAESEDERIRKEIIDFATKANNGVTSILANSYNFNKWIAWLDKQGEQKPVIIIPKFRVGDTIRIKNSNAEYTITEISDGYYRGKGWCLDIAAGDGCGDYELVEQNPTDKVEPKFHEGDWVILTAGELSTTLQIVKVDTNKKLYWFNDSSYLPIVDEECLHFWSIHDAKDGDVLCTKNKCCPFIYDKGRYNNGLAYYYAGIDVSGNLNIKSPHNMLAHFGRLDNIRPATKEQRDLLFQKMHETGYEWNAEKKELKKVEQKPTAWSEEDREYMQSLLDIINGTPSLTPSEVECHKDWLKSLKDRVLPRPKQEWSEDDEEMIENIIGTINMSIEDCDVDDIGTKARFSLEKERDWLKNKLKSLSPQSHWKPSEEQLYTLEKATHIVGSKYKSYLASLYQELKKLK